VPAFGSQLFNTTEQGLCKTNTSDNHIIHLQPITALDPTLRQTNTVHIFPCNLSKIIWILSSQLPIYTQVLEAVSFFHVFLQKPPHAFLFSPIRATCHPPHPWFDHPNNIYKVVQIWPGLFVCKQVTVCPGHIWTTLYVEYKSRSSSLCNLLKPPVTFSILSSNILPRHPVLKHP
jgi:hypothetical protein